jgi:hypothetical protein
MFSQEYTLECFVFCAQFLLEQREATPLCVSTEMLSAVTSGTAELNVITGI